MYVFPCITLMRVTCALHDKYLVVGVGGGGGGGGGGGRELEQASNLLK